MAAVEEGFGTAVLDTWDDPWITEQPKVSFTRPDPRLTPGTLMLLDPHAAGFEWPGGVPAASATSMVLPNVAREQAAAILGVDVGLLNSTTFSIVPGPSVIERSAKGGIHVVLSTTLATAQRGFYIPISAPVYDYMRSHPTDPWYVSAWVRRTKAAPGAAAIAQINGTTTGYVAAFGTVDIQAGTTVIGEQNRISNALGPVHMDQAVTGFSATQFVPFAYDGGRANLFNMATTGYNVGANMGKGGAAVSYGGCVVNLKLAELSWDEMHAIDLAEFTSRVTTTGGDFYGDTTPTNPANIT